MSNSPVPDPSPQGPAYEGRLLPRPDDEVIDQGAGFDATTILSRRRILGMVGLGVGGLALAACGSSDTKVIDAGSSTSASSGAGGAGSTSEGEIPEETNGPYPADGTSDLNVLTESGIVRSDITTNLDGSGAVAGVPLALTFKLIDMAGDDAPFEDAVLYAWQCNAQGEYSMYTSGVEDDTFLRGMQVADADGELTFQTIVPGCYQGRWPHIHFEVYPDLDSATDVSNAIATSQLAFPPKLLERVYQLDAYAGSTENLAGVGTKISDDGIFGDGDWKLEVPTFTGNPTKGYTATLDVAIDTTTDSSSGGTGGAPAGSSSGDAGGPPPGGGTPPSGAPEGTPPGQ
ncbi:intradiol ring-cleavage dioxygenase [Nocardioides acrostichi]|uniref:Intradiol ring-cleavage dioxygenase n=1 Tax=Nocardioides acrostichi TaxID=2784339 RepID=A0A930V2X2_9ACTN|nr:intradiol ring-cleavage dioxygenase [Nocardioides acrostichi]MBF4162765.1 intradiol ring-cleavage dioxygenase [Nocardioides acrostichi]